MLKNYIKKFERYSVVISLLMVVLSIFMIVRPMKSMEVFIIAFSVILLVNGIGSFIAYFSCSSEEKIFSFDFIIGIITIIAGILVYIYRLNLLDVFPIILGIWIVITNLFRLQLAINFSSIENSNSGILIVLSILMIAVGILLIINPFASIITVTTLVGIFLLISEVSNIFECMYVIFILNKLEKVIKNIQ